ncbi:MAG: cytochrome c oxidase subunit 3 [Kofleriaceae bacterium]
MGPYFDPCVSSGEASLLTKSNACPGHQGSVYFHTEAAQSGCYPDLAIDQDSEKTGVQLQCKISETVRMPHLIEKKDEKGVVQKDQDGKPLLAVETDRYKRWVFESKKSTPVLEQCEPAKMHEEHHEGAKPCWRYAPQPAVCRPGYFFTARCAAGAPCDTRDKHKPFDISSRFIKKGDCEGLASDLKREVKKYTEKAEADAKAEAEKTKTQPLPITPFGLEVTECRLSNSAGFLIEHHDHIVRDPETAAENPNKLPIYPAKLLAVADCASPPAPKAKGDVFAEPTPEAPVVGQKAIGTAAHELTPEEEHEQLYLGPPPDHTGMFFTIYFAMTGLHGIHVLVGVFVFIWLLIRATKGHFTPEYFGPVDFAALYWHIVDLIWIFLFPLLYLIH